MATVNTKRVDKRKDKVARLAGGFGNAAAVQGAEALLRRSVLACLLWEDNFYEDGVSGAENIKRLVPQVPAATVALLAIEARNVQKLRHVPLLLAREMLKHEPHRLVVGDLLPQIIKRPDEITEFIALYWQDGKTPLANQVKRGLAEAFNGFDAYQFAKWNRKKDVMLRDVMFLVHPTPKNKEQAQLFKQLADNELPIPDTWEVELSTSKNKKASWERLINENRLGALAYLRNLRNMEQAGVDFGLIRQGLQRINGRWLLPINYLAAAKAAPRFERDIENSMLRNLRQLPKLNGHTVFVVDVSGSMGQQISERSEFTRADVACAMAMLANELCESVTVYATAGSDGSRTHATKLVPSRHGFGMVDAIKAAEVGYGGIFTRQCLDYIRQQERGTPDRIIVFSDSQDCDHPHLRVPEPFGKRNYIIDVSAHSRGINYKGVWDAEISGWSEGFLRYIQELESGQQ